MEEADLLKERLQAITDKRRIQEDIARKRRQIEEEKLKLQYIKKKALREQWLMDGLSQQSEQEQEAMRLQAQDEQQQSDQLQSNILRIEKEIEELETQELNISANEELVLKRLKEVERTPEDIIKELNTDVRPDVTDHVTSPLPDLPSCTSVTPVKTVCQAEGEEPKRATFAMEISVELDKRTGRTQIISAASITPQTVEGRGLKVYDDGRKSVYALHPEGGGVQNGTMTPLEVEELLRQATDQDLNTEVQYHPPVYAAPYTGNTRPSTPRMPSKRPTPTPSPSLTENQQRPDLSRAPVSQDPPSGAPPPTSYIPAQSERHQTPQCDGRTMSSNTAALVSVRARAAGLPAPTQPLFRAMDTHNPSVNSPSDITRRSPSEGMASLNLVTTPPDESQPVTMIFMGYEKAENEEDEDIQAELVVIGNSDDDDDDDEGDEGAEPVSFHPQGYRSRVFQPPVGRATVRGPQDQNHHWDQDLDLDQDQDQLLRPTFTHKTRSGRGGSEMKLCSTGR